MILQPSRPSGRVNSPNPGDSGITGPNNILGHTIRLSEKRLVDKIEEGKRGRTADTSTSAIR
jgi:hypothetical protein